MLMSADAHRSDDGEGRRLHRLLRIIDEQYDIDIRKSFGDLGCHARRRIWSLAQALTI